MVRPSACAMAAAVVSVGLAYDTCSVAELRPQWARLWHMAERGAAVFEGGPSLAHAPVSDVLRSTGVAAVPVVGVDDAELARKLVAANVPFVMRSADKALGLRDRWTEAYMRSEWADMRVLAQRYGGGRLRYASPRSWRRVERGAVGNARRTRSSVGELFADVDARGEREMIYAGTTGGSLKSYTEDYKLIVGMFDEYRGLIPGHRWGEPTLRFGFDAVEYAPHFDWGSNFLVQLNSSKRVVLLNPLEAGHMYWEENEAHPQYRQSYVWPRAVGGGFGRFSDARAVQCTLGPGDVLYIPPVWWHYIERGKPEGTSAWTSLNRMADVPIDAGTGERVFVC